MRRAFAKLLGLAGGATSAVAGQPAVTPPPAQVGAPAAAQGDFACAIDHTIKGGIAEIRGVAISGTGGTATYRLLVRKVGTAGTSDLSQGGRVVLEPGGRTSAGSVNVSVEAGARYEASLTIEVGGSRRECHVSGETDLKL